MIYLFANLKEPFVNPSKTNSQCRRSQSCSPPSCARLSRFVCKELHYLVRMMVAQIVECLVYVHTIKTFCYYDLFFVFCFLFRSAITIRIVLRFIPWGQWLFTNFVDAPLGISFITLLIKLYS